MSARPIHKKQIICERCENEDCGEQGRWNPFFKNNPAECSSFKPTPSLTEQSIIEKIRKQMSSSSGGIVIW